MTKKQLYFVIGILTVVLCVVLFIPTEKKIVEAPAQEVVSEPTDNQSAEGEASTELDTVRDAVFPEQVILEGTFLSLTEGENQHGKTFEYMLLHDGVEVLRIDLRPLLGYSELNVEEKLGVARGAQVRVVGIMEDGEFKVSSVVAQ